MFAPSPSAPDAPTTQSIPRVEPLHLLLVRTPPLTERGREWLERTRAGAFNGLELQRLIRLEKLNLG